MTPRKTMLVFLKAHLKLHVAGMRHSRITPTQFLKMATQHTNITYRRGQYKKALADVEKLLQCSA